MTHNKHYNMMLSKFRHQPVAFAPFGENTLPLRSLTCGSFELPTRN